MLGVPFEENFCHSHVALLFRLLASTPVGSTLLSLLLFPEARGAVSALGWMGYMLSLIGLATYAIPPTDRKADSKVKEMQPPAEISVPQSPLGKATSEEHDSN